jgi:hypothetical protein
MKKSSANTQAATENKSAETKRQKGLRLALKRMPLLKKRMHSIGNLGSYGLSPEHLNQMIASARESFTEMEMRLKNHREEQYHFTFK